MIKLNRTKQNKWILQKNINSKDLFKSFIYVMDKQGNNIDSKKLKSSLRSINRYVGRSAEGSDSTMGVRLSQMCFYMVGYKKGGMFLPSPVTQLYIKKKLPTKKLFLINLFSMQFPSPYSKTPENFNIFFGRLILKLLTDARIDKRLYIDECFWFLPFIEQINNSVYEELINSILEYRKLNYAAKLKLFMSIPDSEDLFSNCVHEMNYYFLRIFKEFGVLNITEDKSHNAGKLFKFRHGNTATFRTDAWDSNKLNSGYVEINSDLFTDVEKLFAEFSAFDKPSTQSESLSKEDWIRDLYEFNILDYINVVSEYSKSKNYIIEVIKEMLYASKYGSRDGTTFQNKLKPFFELFSEINSVEIIGGSGDTDLLCVVSDTSNYQNKYYKINVDAKTSKNRTAQLNPIRLTKHLSKNGSKYCIVVSPKFCKGVRDDINGFKIVTIDAEVLANYCLKDCLDSEENLANYSFLNQIIMENLGCDISKILDKQIDTKFKLSID